MRVVYVINAIKRSGPNIVLRNMISGSKNEIYIISFLPQETRETDELKNLGATVIHIPTKKNTIPFTGSRALSIELSTLQPDIVHSHGILSDIAVARAGYGHKSVSTVHNDMFEDYIFRFGRLKGLVYIILHIIYLRRFKKVVCCSRSASVKLQKYINNITFVHNGIGLATQAGKKAIRTDLGLPVNAYVFVYAGDLSVAKNTDELVDNFTKYRDDNDYLLLAGRGPLYEKYRNNPDTHILTLGYVNDITAIFKQADVYISLSRSEGFSISVLEAIRANMLVMLSDIPSHRELFEVIGNQKIGELVQGSFQKSFQKIHDNSGIESSKVFKNHFTSTVMMKHYNNIYKDVLK